MPCRLQTARAPVEKLSDWEFCGLRILWVGSGGNLPRQQAALLRRQSQLGWNEQMRGRAVERSSRWRDPGPRQNLLG